MTLKLGILMDPINTIKPYKDTSFAMLLEAQRRGYQLYYFEMRDLWLENGQSGADMATLTVRDKASPHYELGPRQSRLLADMDIILMRKDPPVDQEYIYATYLLELAEMAGTLVVNKPQSLRDANEKLYTAHFADLTPPTLVSRNADHIRRFYQQHGDIILKPLDGMGGASIFRVKAGDTNLNVIIETLTEHGRRLAMAQAFIPAIRDGDKRVLLVDGQAIPYTLARIPQAGETRGNLAAGGRGEVRPITPAESAIAERIGPVVREKGLLFVGLDVIGGKLTEINVTSPTCVREIEAASGIHIMAMLFDALEARLAARGL